MAIPTRFYDLADRLLQAAPWELMSEVQLIGLRHPVTGELAHLSVMGASGEHRCLVIYLGAEAIHRFNLLQRSAVDEASEMCGEDTTLLLLGARQLQVAFSIKKDLHKSEAAAMKKAGRRYRGDWPTFRSIYPGRVPTPRLTEEEMIWIETAIGQLLEVVPLVEKDPMATSRPGPGAGTEILTREFKDGHWRTVWTPEDTGLYEMPSPETDAFLAGRVERLETGEAVETLLLLMPGGIGKSDDDAVFGHLLLTVDSVSGLIRGVEVTSVESISYDEMMEGIPAAFLNQCLEAGEKPAAIHVGSMFTFHLLEKTAAALGIPIGRVEELPALEDALDSMMGYIGD